MPCQTRLAVAAVLALALAMPARAQFIYSDPPPLMGERSYHLYSVPGVIANGGLGTFFACSNTTAASIRVGVEIFGPPGGAAINDPSAASLEISPGGSKVLATGPAMGISVDSSLGGAFSKGTARILATAKKGIICSAFVADVLGAIPASMADLKVVAKSKQRGE